MKIHKKVESRLSVEFAAEHRRGHIERVEFDENRIYHRFFIHVETRPNLSVADQPKPYEENWTTDELKDLRDALVEYLHGLSTCKNPEPVKP